MAAGALTMPTAGRGLAAGTAIVVDPASTSIPGTFLAIVVAPLLPVAATLAILRYRPTSGSSR
jgi:hypothetical protein